MRSFLYCAVVMSTLAAACGDGGGGPPTPGPATGLTVVSGDPQQGQAGQPLAAPLVVKVVDASNRAVVGTVVNFSVPIGQGTLSASRDTSDAQGLASVTWTLGSQTGTTRAEARVSGITGAAVFNATILAGPAAGIQRFSNAPGSSAAGFELPDSVAIKVADQFGNGVANAAVTFAITGGGGSISPATGTTNAEGVVRTNWTLGGAGLQSLRASAGTLETTVDANAAACSQNAVPVGGVLTLGPSDPRCVVLTGTAQRYFVTVVNTSPTAATTNAFRVRGAGAGTGTPRPVVSARTASSLGLGTSGRELVDDAREQIETHKALMRANERIMQEYAPRAAFTRSARTQNSVLSVSAPPPNVGDTLNMRIPTNFANLCSLTGAANVRARVVFVGQHGVVLEDVTTTVAGITGQMDTLYVKVGQEFDNTMWTILTTNYGNPLAMDAQTDNNQRFFMLFSKAVNDMQGGGIAGFVASSDFFGAADGCPAGNKAEVFYARVPTTTATDYSNGSAKDWYRRTRTVMIHEVKHIVSFAERLARGQQRTAAFNEADRWLEESSAMLAEELWARTQYGYAAKTNVAYNQSIGCEVRPNGSVNPTYGNCGLDKPLSMFDHFILFYDYQTNVEGLTPIGAADAEDFTFYGSGWSFLRWVIDTYASTEGSFLTAMTNELTLPGVQNIEARTARTFADLVNDWAIAVALDDYPGFTPLNARHQLVSWNSRDIFNGMNVDFSNQGFFTRPVPLQIRPASFGKFAIDVSSVRGGSMAVFEVTGTQANQQMFEFNGLAGATFPADMRVNIIRVQ